MLRKILLTFLAAGLLCLLYSVIFSFSAQDGTQSGNLSMMVSEKCVELFNSLTGRGWTESVIKNLAAYFEHPIRKLAHFAEYALMGVLVYILWRQWMMRGRKLYLLIVLWVFVSATADEIHQFFVPDRWCSPGDILLDTLGGIFGLWCIITAGKIYRHFLK